MLSYPWIKKEISRKKIYKMIEVNVEDIVIINPGTVPQTPNETEDEGELQPDAELENPPEKPSAGKTAAGSARIQRSFAPVTGGIGKPQIKKAESTLGKAGTIYDVAQKWDKLANEAVSRGMSGMSDTAKMLLRDLISTKAKVNWRIVLKKFFDKIFNKEEDVLPNRRLLGTGDILYGTKKSDSDELKTLVIAIDTSGSISKKQCSVFLNEVYNLTKTFEFDQTVIIYCDDNIPKGAVDRVKKKGKLDLEKWQGGGGTAFAPPFAWCEDNKIVPTAFIYFTDMEGPFPSVNSFGIKKYKDKVLWFVITPGGYKKPPFGKHIQVPIDNQGNFV
jgi:predicted metal-dependent peptidase